MATPTDLEQYVVELVNRARSDPEAEADRLGIDLNDGLDPGTISADPKQPLAIDTALTDAARGHSQWMLEEDIFSHTGANGTSPGNRMANAGYVFSGSWGWGENIAWQGTTGSVSAALRTAFVAGLHDGLFRSAGHRRNILSESFREIGVGEDLGVFTRNGTDYNASMLTQNFAYSGTGYFLTGVIYDDNDGDDFYSPGEGRGAVAVSLGGAGSTTWSSGGYSLGYTGAGWQTVTFSGGGIGATKSLRVLVGGENVKIDLVDGDTVQTSTGVELVSGIANVVHLGLYGGSSTGDGNANSMTGGSGIDVFDGAGGDDIISGRAGNDLLIGGPGADMLDGGAGIDTADYSGSGSGVTVTLGVSASGGDAEGDVLTQIENLTGSSFDDRLLGDGGANTLSGGDGNDFLSGLGGPDMVFGGDGFDILVGGDGGGADTLDGGPGQDVAHYFDATSALVVDFTNPANNSGEVTADTWISIEGIIGANNFSNTLTGDGQDNLFIGGVVADAIDGGGGADVLVGNGGNDTLDGGAGADVLIGDAGDDTLTGGIDGDVFFFNQASGNGADTVTDFVIGEDLVLFYRTGLTFADLSFSDVAGGALADYGGASDSILFAGRSASEMDDSANFVFFA